MFQRFHEMRERREDGGFTLIELLVVVLIIAILAAIAIPFFLKQRERSWEAQAQSALKNAATAMESYGTGNNGDYTGVVVPGVPGPPATGLFAEGYKATQGVTLTPGTITATSYCIQADHGNLATNWHYSSSDAKPLSGNCPP